MKECIYPKRPGLIRKTEGNIFYEIDEKAFEHTFRNLVEEPFTIMKSPVMSVDTTRDVWEILWIHITRKIDN